MKLVIVTGSRADRGLLEMPIRALQADDYFKGQILSVHGMQYAQAFEYARQSFALERPDMILVLGDRYEILAVATAAHVERVPIAHIAGGDISEGSYDDAMRDCISRMATIHFPCSRQAEQRLTGLGYSNVHWIGNVALDYILTDEWLNAEFPRFATPYVVVGYYPETIDDTVDLEAVRAVIAGRPAIWIKSNPDRGSEHIPGRWEFDHPAFIKILADCDEFIGNSSAIFYEAPALGIKTSVIGKRQRGRFVPTGDGHASERIVKVLKEWRA